MTSIQPSTIRAVGPEFEPTMYVDDDNTAGPWDGSWLHPFQHIQDAIDNAIDGDVIFVFNGIYYENIVIDKRINLIGNNYQMTIIDGNNIDYTNAIDVTANGTRINGFTIQHAFYYGIHTEASFTNITGNIIRNNSRGPIYMNSGAANRKSSGNIVHFNTMQNNGEGIRVLSGCDFNVISDNIIENNTGDCISFYESSNNIIARNTIRKNGAGIDLFYGFNNVVFSNLIINNSGGGVTFTNLSNSICYRNTITGNNGLGIVVYDHSSNCIVANNNVSQNKEGRGLGLWDISHCLISGNRVTGHSGDGIAPSIIDNCTITGNVISGNWRGITAGRAETRDNILTNNTIRDNTFRGIDINAVRNWQIYHNNFINNGEGNAYELGTNAVFDDGYPSGGNYWSDYHGNDVFNGPNQNIPGSDGIGDTQYSIPTTGDRKDRYPLMANAGDLMPLSISVPPAVQEGDSFQVTITSQALPVAQAVILFNNQTYTTNTQGAVTLTAPSVEQTADTWISAYIQGYHYNLSLVTIKNTQAQMKQLIIEAPASLVNGDPFSVRVTADGSPVEHVAVYVYYGNESYDNFHLTNTAGIVSLTAPIIKKDTNLYIDAIREGFLGNEVIVPVLVQAPEIKNLTIIAPSSVEEKTDFIVTIKTTETNQPAVNIDVTFNGQTSQTNIVGQVTFRAPAVQQDTGYTIIAHHEGYKSNSTTITVLNNPENASIHLISPNGNESLQGSQRIEWTIVSPDSLDHHAITIQYQYANGLWITLVEHQENVTSSYLWDTRTVSDGYPYMIKVILKKDDDLDGIYETIIDEDTSDAPFAIDNSLIHQGWIHGFVTENLNDNVIFLRNATVSVILSNINNVITSRCTFTDESGEYTIPVQAGVYTMIAGKTGYSDTIVSNVTVWINQTTLVNFSLDKGTSTTLNLFVLNENRDEINKAIRDQQVGGELSIIKSTDLTAFEKQIFIYDSVMISPTDVTNTKVSLLVSGDEKNAGRTIVINLDKNVIDLSKDLELKYDNEPLVMAADLADVLDPNNDGLHAEYLITKGANGFQILVSIPHFSEHQITISSLEKIMEPFGGILAVIIYIVVLSVFAVVSAVPVLRLWKKIE